MWYFWRTAWHLLDWYVKLELEDVSIERLGQKRGQSRVFHWTLYSCFSSFYINHSSCNTDSDNRICFAIFLSGFLSTLRRMPVVVSRVLFGWFLRELRTGRKSRRRESFSRKVNVWRVGVSEEMVYKCSRNAFNLLFVSRQFYYVWADSFQKEGGVGVFSSVELFVKQVRTSEPLARSASG